MSAAEERKVEGRGGKEKKRESKEGDERGGEGSYCHLLWS